MKPARLGLSPSEGRSVFFFARDCLFHAPQNQDKTGARGGPFFLPAVAIQDFSPVFFLLFFHLQKFWFLFF
jgi:hypothetical protein